MRCSSAIQRGIEEGLGVEQTADIIRDQYGYNQSRSETIARTEIGNVIEDSRNAAFESLGVEKTIWVSARDPKVRPTHEESFNPDPVKLGDTFPNGLRYPNDPLGDAADVINCRCIAIPAVED
jgi:SPP1 gp7 family putative phage head morphogenesis protein